MLMKTSLTVYILCMYLNCAYSQVKGEVYQIGDENNYCAAIKTSIFQYYAAEQEYDNWCWAACIQMVLNYQGLTVSQDEIVMKAFGSVVNKPADCYVMKNAADGWDINGKYVTARQVSDRSPHSFIDALANKYPVVIGLNMPGQNVGHAYVLTAVFYQYDQSGQKIPYKVVLRDPWPSNPSRTELKWSNFINRINCIVHISNQY